jgi:hypothetical protein
LRINKSDQESLYILGDLPVLVNLTLEIVNNVEDIPSTDQQQQQVWIQKLEAFQYNTRMALSLQYPHADV